MFRKPMSRFARRSALAGGAFALAAVSACSGGSGASTSSSPPALGAVPSNASAASLALPVERYLFTPSQVALLEYAAYESSRTCMQRYGLSAPDVPRPTGVYAGGLVALRYGPADGQSAARYGYHRTAAALVPQGSGPKVTSLSSFSPAAFLVFTGTAPTGSNANTIAAQHNLGTIPAGGCRAVGDQAIAASAVLAQSPAAEQVKNQGFADSQADPRVTAVVHAWSRCMKTAGYDYASPIDAYGDPRWSTSSVSRVEIDAAVADVACKQKTNLVGVWFAVESAWEVRLMADDRGQLATELAGKTAQLARASAYLSGAGPTASSPAG